jgi:hypothetical protein
MDPLPEFSMINIIEQARIVWSKYNLEDDELFITEDRTKHDSLLYQDDSLDFSWFSNQAKFIDGLTDRETFLLKTYTRNGDEVINSLFKLKGRELVDTLMKTVTHLKTPDRKGKPRVNIFDPVKLETITPANVVTISSKYANEVISIFNKAPPVENTLRVFRGLRPNNDDGKLTVFPLRGITSTTYNPMDKVLTTYSDMHDVVKGIDNKGKSLPPNCCVYDMILRRGVKAIWLEPITEFPGEQEIVLLPTLIQASYSHPKLKTYYPKDSGYYQSVQVQTYDVIINPIVGKTFTMKGGLRKRFKRKARKTHRK